MRIPRGKFLQTGRVKLIWFLLPIVWNILPAVLLAQGKNAASPTSLRKLPSVYHSSALDAPLHHCFVASLDRAWAVGDRGLILVTHDGGKTWSESNSGVEVPLYGVTMMSEREGCIVGGSVLEYAQRSVGVVLVTADGGKTWKGIEQSDLPRLIGIQHLGSNHIIAWGDYSPHYRTSLFESDDGGSTWTAARQSLGHVQASGWIGRERGVAIDRLGRVYRLTNIKDVELVPGVGGDPTRPLLCVHACATGFWLGGCEGQLLHSLDGAIWKVKKLPGNANDHRWITIQSIYTHGNQIWIAGKPGNVIWHSADNGTTWKVQTIPSMTAISHLAGNAGERLVATGPFARILGTRNSGRGWWLENSSGERTGLLNIVSTETTAAWDALAMTSWQYARHASLYITHAHRFESRVDMAPDFQARLETVRSKLALASIDVEPSFPLNDYDRFQVDRKHPYLQDPSTESVSVATKESTSEGVLAMVLAIRALRPDVVITDTQSATDKLEVANCSAAMAAVSAAAEDRLQLFSVESGIPNTPWKTPKVFSRSTIAKSAMAIPPKQLVKTGQCLQEILRPLEGMGIEVNIRHKESPQQYLLVQTSSVNDTARRELFGSIALDAKSARPGSAKGMPMNVVMQTQQLESRFEALIHHSGPRYQKDPSWEQELDRLLANASSDRLPTMLFDGSQSCLENGYWNRWRALTEKLLRNHMSEGVTAAAYRQLLFYAGSTEIDHWLQQQIALERDAIEQSQSSAVAVAVAASAPASPFERGSRNEVEVRTAAFGAGSATSVISTAGNERTLSNSSLPSESKLPFLNTQMLGWAHKQINNYQPVCNFDPRMRLAKYFGSSLSDKGSEGRQAVFQDLAEAKPIAGWRQVGLQEIQGAGKRLSSDVIIANPMKSRPILDGKLDDECWKSIKPIALSDPWNTLAFPTTKVQIGYDRDYLCFAFQGRKSNADDSLRPSDKKKVRTHDGMQTSRDHLMIRLDLDRDYATWFGFGIDCEGELLDECCHWKKWNPIWHVNSLSTESEWIVEVAIPMRELTLHPIEDSERWAIDVRRILPGLGTQSVGRVASDQFLPQGMRLLHFQGD